MLFAWPPGPACGAAGGMAAHLPIDPMSASGARTASSLALVDSKQGTGLTGPGGGLPPGGAPGLPGVPLSDDPYRGMNPRQPAPWSMQVSPYLEGRVNALDPPTKAYIRCSRIGDTSLLLGGSMSIRRRCTHPLPSPLRSGLR